MTHTESFVKKLQKQENLLQNRRKCLGSGLSQTLWQVWMMQLVCIKTENNHYLNTSEKIIEASEKAEVGVVIDHFRRGYFKRLSSDFYKNKKGQIVFVHETVVNGQAKTLEEKKDK